MTAHGDEAEPSQADQKTLGHADTPIDGLLHWPVSGLRPATGTPVPVRKLPPGTPLLFGRNLRKLSP